MRIRAVGVLVARREDLVRSSIVRENKNSSKAISDITYLLQVNAGIKELSILEKGFVFFFFSLRGDISLSFCLLGVHRTFLSFCSHRRRRELKTHRGVNEMNRLQTDRRSQLYTWYYGYLCRKVKRWFHLDFKCFFLMDQQMVPYKVGLLTDTHFKQKGMAREWVDWGF